MTCQHCTHFSLDRVNYPNHAAVGMGRCALVQAAEKDAFLRLARFVGQGSTCARIALTPERRRYLDFKRGVKSAI